MKIRVERIGPKRAQELLDHQHANRKVKRGHLARLIQDAKQGRWTVAGASPIILDADDVLIDGQHRMQVVVQTGLTLDFIVQRLEAGESVIAARTIASATAVPSMADNIKFHHPDTVSVSFRAAVIKAFYHLEKDLHPSKPINYLDAMPFMDKHKKLFDWAVEIHTGAAIRRLVIAPFCGFWIWMMTPKKGGADLTESVKAFAQRYVEGTGLATGDPELTLRNSILKETDIRDRAALLIRLGNAFWYSYNGKKRSRAMGSLESVESIAKLIGKPTPSWLPSGKSFGNGLDKDTLASAAAAAQPGA